MMKNYITNIPKDYTDIFIEAYENSYSCQIDELFSQKYPNSVYRNRSDLSFNQAFDIIKNNSPHKTIILRNVMDDDVYWEFGISSLSTDSEYGIVYIFINVKIDNAEKIFKKYNLNT